MIAGDRPTNHTCIWPQSVQVCANEILSFRAGKCRSSGAANAVFKFIENYCCVNVLIDLTNLDNLIDNILTKVDKS